MTVNFLFKMTNYLQQRFNKFLDIGTRSDYSHVKKQRIKNTNLAALLSFSVGTLSTLFTFQIISTPYVFIPLGACCLYLMSLVLNFFYKHTFASLNVDLITTLLFFWLANAYGKESSAYLLFILAEMATIFNYHKQKSLTLLWSLLLPLLGAIISFATDFSLFLVSTITQTERWKLSPIMFFITMVGSGVVILAYRLQLDKNIESFWQSKMDLQEKYSELEQVNQELNKANSELDQFVYRISHDLLGPISSSLGLVDLCKTDAKNLELYLTLQEKSLYRLDYYVKEIINYSGNVQLDFVSNVEIDFEESIKTLFVQQCKAESAQNIVLEIKTEGNMPFYADEFRYNVILQNLISNAIRYRNPKETNSYVRCEIFVEEKEARIDIIDNGVGIPKKYQADIFQIFYRADPRSTGPGLGLYITKEALKKINGKIEVFSEEHIGTKIRLFIPNIKDSVSSLIDIN
jgi:signal transduction histidine kinase